MTFGKFENCPGWATQEYNRYLDGTADIHWVDDLLVSSTTTDSGEVRALWEDDVGFVHCREFKTKEAFSRWLTDMDPLAL